ncbi:hypothetical protein Tco_0919473, partial [Tanacetum coccineum]
MYRANPGTVGDRVNQSSFEKFFNFLFNNIVDFWIYSSLMLDHYVQDDYTADPFFEDIVDKDAAVTPDLERKSDGTEEINIEEKKAYDVKSGDTEELDLKAVQSTARQ